MKRAFIVSTWIATIAMPMAALAQQFSEPTGVPKNLCELVTLIRNVSNTAFFLLLVVALVMFLIGAFYYLFAGADEKNKTTGRQYLMYAAVAIVIGFVAFGLAQVVLSILGAGVQDCAIRVRV